MTPLQGRQMQSLAEWAAAGLVQQRPQREQKLAWRPPQVRLRLGLGLGLGLGRQRKPRAAAQAGPWHLWRRVAQGVQQDVGRDVALHLDARP